MGLLDSVKKIGSKISGAVSSVWGGVKNVFKKAMGAFGKFMGTKIGKVIMVGLAIFTLGTALAAGASAWSTASAVAASQGAAPSLMANVMAAGSATMSSLTGGLVGTSAASQAATAGLAGAGNAAGAFATGAQQGAQVAETLGESGQAISAAAGNAQAALDVGNTGFLAKAGQGFSAANEALASSGAVSSATQAATGAGGFGGGVLKAAQAVGKGAWDFAKTDAGSNILGKAVEGYGTGQAADEAAQRVQKEDRRFQKLWSNIEGTGLDNPNTYKVNTPDTVNDDYTQSKKLNDYSAGYNYTPTGARPA